jgi:hypothetical protein
MSKKDSTSSSQTTIPPEVLARYNAVNTVASNVAQTPYQQYSTDPNAYVAPLTQTQQAGITNTNQYAGAAQPYYGAATGLTLAGAGPANLSQLNTNAYMSPYMQDVVRTQLAAQSNQNAQQSSALQGQQIQAGAFGGDRAGIGQANLAYQQNLANQQSLANTLQSGYTQAQNTAVQQQGAQLGAQQANLSRLLGAGNQLGTLGTNAQAAGLQGAQAQLQAGGVQQQTQQAGLTALANQFQQAQSYPFQTAQFLANIAEGTGALSGQSTTTTQPGSFFSDERLKEDIHQIGETYDGQKIIRYRYKGSPDTHVGLSAQDVEKHHPEAVGESHGYKTVDYDEATRSAAKRGHYYSGGLVPSSQGGMVNAGHMGEGYADGGAPAPAAAAAGDAGGGLGGLPFLGGNFNPSALAGLMPGGSSYNPAIGATGYDMPVGGFAGLMNQSFAPPQMQTPSDFALLNPVKSGIAGQSGITPEQYKAMFSAVLPKAPTVDAKPATGLVGSDYGGGGEGAGSMAGDRMASQSANADAGYGPSGTPNTAGQANRGGRIHRDTGGGLMPYGGLSYVPQFQPQQRQMLKPADAPQKQSSGLQDLTQTAATGLNLDKMYQSANDPKSGLGQAASWLGKQFASGGGVDPYDQSGNPTGVAGEVGLHIPNNPPAHSMMAPSGGGGGGGGGGNPLGTLASLASLAALFNRGGRAGYGLGGGPDNSDVAPPGWDSYDAVVRGEKNNTPPGPRYPNAPAGFTTAADYNGPLPEVTYGPTKTGVVPTPAQAPASQDSYVDGQYVAPEVAAELAQQNVNPKDATGLGDTWFGRLVSRVVPDASTAQSSSREYQGKVLGLTGEALQRFINNPPQYTSAAPAVPAAPAVTDTTAATAASSSTPPPPPVAAAPRNATGPAPVPEQYVQERKAVAAPGTDNTPAAPGSEPVTGTTPPASTGLIPMPPTGTAPTAPTGIAPTQGNFVSRNQDWLVPLLSGLGTMASSPSRYLGAALLQGVGGAAGAYENVQNQQIKRAQEEAVTRLRNVEAARNAIFNAPGPNALTTNPNGKVVLKPYSPGIPVYTGENTQSPNVGPANIQPPAIASIPKIPGVNYTGATRTAAQSDNFTPTRYDEDKLLSADYQKTVLHAEQSAQDNKQSTQELVAQLANTGSPNFLDTPGFGFESRAKATSALNTIAKAMNLGDQYFGTGAEQQDITSKINTLSAQLRAVGANERSLGALNALRGATPNLNLDPVAAATLASLAASEQQRVLDKANFLRQYRQDATSGSLLNADSEFEKANPRGKYTQEAAKITQAMLDPRFGPAIKKIASGGISSERIDQFFGIPGMGRYFPSPN